MLADKTAGQSANARGESSALEVIDEATNIASPEPPAPPAAPSGSAVAVLQIPPIEVDDTHEGISNDRDSAVDADEDSTTSTSLASSILNYQYAYGRRYHAYKKGSYLLPNDEEEQDRLDLLHHVFLLILNGRLFVSPLSYPGRVLDVGTGTGLWAMDVADTFPTAQVIGTDLSPIQPGWVPPNVQFYIDDLENEWMYQPGDAFDLVYTRVMGGSIGDWDRFVRQAFMHLKPGGWLELHEPESWFTSDDDSIDRVTYTNKFQEKCVEAARHFGKDINLAHTHKQRLVNAGFVDVRDEVIKIPTGTWPKEPRLKEIGGYWLEHMVSGVEVYTLGFIGNVLGWSEIECRILAAKVSEELRDRKNHLYIPLHIVYGRKPT